jgi:hypothetical protein
MSAADSGLPIASPRSSQSRFSSVPVTVADFSRYILHPFRYSKPNTLR